MIRKDRKYQLKSVEKNLLFIFHEYNKTIVNSKICNKVKNKAKDNYFTPT